MKKSRFWPIDDRLAHWHPVARFAELGDRPLSVTACGVPVAIFRAEDGIRAVYDRCAHRRAPLSQGRVEGNSLVCIYHGCAFEGAGRGYCPTTRSWRFTVPRFEVRVARETLWIRSPDAMEWTGTGGEISPLLLQDDADFAGIVHKDIAAPLQLVVDNMTELEHTGEVHRSLAFGPDDYDTITHDARDEGDTVAIDYAGRQRPLPLHLRGLTGVRPGDHYVQDARVRFTPPHATYEIRWQTPEGAVRDFGLRFVIYYTPVTPERTSLFAFVFWKARHPLRRAAMAIGAPILRHIVGRELGRDKAIIESLPRDEARLDLFQLSRYDRPLVMTRAAMARLYPEGGTGQPHLRAAE